MAPGGQRLAASVSGVSLAVLGGKVRGEQEEEVTLVTRDEEGAGLRGALRAGRPPLPRGQPRGGHVLPVHLPPALVVTTQ